MRPGFKNPPVTANTEAVTYIFFVYFSISCTGLYLSSTQIPFSKIKYISHSQYPSLFKTLLSDLEQAVHNLVLTSQLLQFFSCIS